MTESELRQKVVSVAKGWLGYNEANGKFKSIIDLYNTQRPLPVGYKVKYTDEWCAACVTAVGMQAGLHDIILGECSCSRMVALYQKAGRWQENDAYVPKPGDIVMYYWKDGANYATTDCVGSPNHVGIVASVANGSMVIIEGNKGASVAYRSLVVSGRYIRGYCLPDYASKATKAAAPVATPTAQSNTKRVTAKRSAAGRNSTYAGQYVVATESGLNVRDGANELYPVLTTLPHGTVVTNYGYFTTSGGTLWLYVQATVGNTVYTGFCSARYLKRKN